MTLHSANLWIDFAELYENDLKPQCDLLTIERAINYLGDYIGSPVESGIIMDFFKAINDKQFVMGEAFNDTMGEYFLKAMAKALHARSIGSSINETLFDRPDGYYKQFAMEHPIQPVLRASGAVGLTVGAVQLALDKLERPISLSEFKGEIAIGDSTNIYYKIQVDIK